MKSTKQIWKRFLVSFTLLAMFTTTVLPVQAAETNVASGAITNAEKATVKSKKAALNKTNLKLKAGQTYQLKAKNIKGSVKWSSSAKKIATVSKKGKITAKKAGKAIIKATYKKSGKTKILKCKITVTSAKKSSKEATAKEKILALQNKYKEGMRWTNDNYYFWEAQHLNCYGCIALAGKISDTVFGKNAPVKTHRNFAAIKSGDHVRIGDYHSVIVISHTSNSITVVEGNFNNSVHWFREISKSSLQQEGFYVDTRY